jgi:hypothetical protein
MVNNLNDGLAWGLFPVLFAAAGLSLDRIGILARRGHPARRRHRHALPDTPGRHR